MDQWLAELVKQTPAIGGVLVVLWIGKGIIEKVVQHFLAQIKEMHEANAKLVNAYEQTLIRGNALAAQLHERIGEMNTAVKYMNEHLESCSKLVERIHEDNIRMRRDNAA